MIVCYRDASCTLFSWSGSREVFLAEYSHPLISSRPLRNKLPSFLAAVAYREGESGGLCPSLYTSFEATDELLFTSTLSFGIGEPWVEVLGFTKFILE